MTHGGDPQRLPDMPRGTSPASYLPRARGWLIIEKPQTKPFPHFAKREKYILSFP